MLHHRSGSLCTGSRCRSREYWLSRPWLKPAFIGAVALLSTLVVSCSNGNDVGVPEEVVIDASATEDNPVRLKLTELAEFDVYYYTHEETNILDNKLVYPGGLQPNGTGSLWLMTRLQPRKEPI